MQLTFLGTSCMQPTKERNHSAFLLSYKSENILFDCGEGTQRQLKIAGIKPAKITRLLISHWHGDHVLGIPGLLQTMAASEYVNKLYIYGPKKTKEYLGHILKVFSAHECIDFEVHEITKEGKFFDCEDFYLEAYPLEHGIPTLGFSFIEKDRRRIDTKFIKKLGIPEGPELGKLQSGKSIEWKGKEVDVKDATYIVGGKKIAYISDTLLCNNCNKIAKDADLLISESSFSSKLKHKAKEYLHMTAKEAALVANQNNVEQLILTHFSQRYKNTQEIEEDARSVFDNILSAYDFMKVNI